MKVSLVLAPLTICAALAGLQCYAQETSPRASPTHDLQSIVDTKVLRVA
jgi:hypothetical protein